MDSSLVPCRRRYHCVCLRYVDHSSASFGSSSTMYPSQSPSRMLVTLCEEMTFLTNSTLSLSYSSFASLHAPMIFSSGLAPVSITSLVSRMKSPRGLRPAFLFETHFQNLPSIRSSLECVAPMRCSTMPNLLLCWWYVYVLLASLNSPVRPVRLELARLDHLDLALPVY